MGPATFVAGLSDPVFYLISEVEWAGPLRPSGEVEIKKCVPLSTPVLEVKIRCPSNGGHAGASRDRHEWDPTSSLPALDAQDTADPYMDRTINRTLDRTAAPLDR